MIANQTPFTQKQYFKLLFTLFALVILFTQCARSSEPATNITSASVFTDGTFFSEYLFSGNNWLLLIIGFAFIAGLVFLVIAFRRTVPHLSELFSSFLSRKNFAQKRQIVRRRTT